MSCLGGVYWDENVVCLIICEIYILLFILELGFFVVKCELYLFGCCDVYLI